MLLHCDLVYAAPNARLQLPFVNLGLVPEAASSLLLPALVGYQRAAELLLLGEPFSAQKAKDIGLVTEVVAEDLLLETALAQAKKLAQKPATVAAPNQATDEAQLQSPRWPSRWNWRSATTANSSVRPRRRRRSPLFSRSASQILRSLTKS